MKNKDLIYLDTYVLQQDMRIRMPKSILENLDIVKGKSKFKVYYDKINSQLILRVDEDNKDK
ncbi:MULTISPECIES: sucrose-6-phosphate hydrolase [unclassified Campylobacter]|uniref:sucrose-6-phosphate hydrolase n=1 Tax=unclassified Campylobacter TaxID=2593542 RepID=UPI001237D4BC|nr:MULTISPECIES: sucrose-6-phosphate hydrolase [unclassified Campylobacter]KAA6227109.1 sucrose-6-phosphate hydrolase [Campylobacter sp. LR185c]KAA6227494.1 sucrose-6-phosphate hydrolase [Campylobacter sp. LR196d]KAA6228520.1 sucrose-6-phosphate hydrolase [Campylobacter sp. LR286c]KAA6230911.1 sucrose-6-phosphate hydrolase [Campylobacter sp. LR291e]KAA6233545.1 sucrose-6-phosphate hydrolase [Campylobacter sp. LR264d]